MKRREQRFQLVIFNSFARVGAEGDEQSQSEILHMELGVRGLHRNSDSDRVFPNQGRVEISLLLRVCSVRNIVRQFAVRDDDLTSRRIFD